MLTATKKNKFIKITLLLIILSLGLGLRLYQLDKYPLWYDEASAAIEERGLSELPLPSEFLNSKTCLERQDYLFLYHHGFVYYWKKIFGTNDFILKLSSVFWGILGIIIFYFLSQLLYNKKVAIFSTFLLSISSFHIYYSQELRPYAAACFFTLLSFYALLKIIKEKNNNYWTLYILANVFNIYCHYMMLIILLSETLLLIRAYIHEKTLKTSLKKIILPYLLLFTFLLPAILTVYHNLIFALSQANPGELSEFPLWAEKLSFYNLFFTLKNFSLGYHADFFSTLGFLGFLFYLSLFIRNLFEHNAKLKLNVYFFLLMFPISLIFLISKFIKICYVDRYFFPFFPLYLIGISNGILQHKKHFLLICLICSTLFFNGLSLKNYYEDLLPLDTRQRIGILDKNSPSDKITEIIVKKYKKGDHIYSSSKLLVFPLKWYVKKFLKNQKHPRGKSLLAEINAGKLLMPNEEKKITSFIYPYTRPTYQIVPDFNLTKLPNRFWIVHLVSTYKSRLLLKQLRKNFNLKEKQSAGNLRLYLFTR